MASLQVENRGSSAGAGGVVVRVGVGARVTLGLVVVGLVVVGLVVVGLVVGLDVVVLGAAFCVVGADVAVVAGGVDVEVSLELVASTGLVVEAGADVELSAVETALPPPHPASNRATAHSSGARFMVFFFPWVNVPRWRHVRPPRAIGYRLHPNR